MSYASIDACSKDREFVARVTAGTVSEAWNNPALATNGYAADVRASTMNAIAMPYPVATAADVEAAYESALAAGNANPGGDPAVITDGMILANLQAKWPTDLVPSS